MEYADDDPYFDPEEYVEDPEAWLPELPFEYHHPTDSAIPHDIFTWKGLFKTPQYFFDLGRDSEGEEYEELMLVGDEVYVPLHRPTPVVTVNPELSLLDGR